MVIFPGTFRGESGALHSASKVFWSRDLSDQQYLCYLMAESEQLKCLKISLKIIQQKEVPEREEMKERVVPGALVSIPCKDAVVMEHSNLMLLVDSANNLQLYTGLYKVKYI